MSPVLADGYYDGEGNWVEVSPSYDPWSDASPDMDFDGDGISDDEEVFGYEVTLFGSGAAVWIVSDPAVADTDGDGAPDGWERDKGLDPTDPSDAWSDHDGDGLLAMEEFLVSTHPQNGDTDGDGHADGDEVTYLGSNPLDPNDPGEGWGGSGDGDGGGSGSGSGEDGGGEGDGNGEDYDPFPGIDGDSDGISDDEEVSGYQVTLGNGTVLSITSDPTNPDTDGDGMPDG